MVFASLLFHPHGKIRTAVLAELAADAVFHPHRFGFFVGIPLKNLLRAEFDTDAAFLAAVLEDRYGIPFLCGHSGSPRSL
jgi:hypothetical protein